MLKILGMFMALSLLTSEVSACHGRRRAVRRVTMTRTSSHCGCQTGSACSCAGNCNYSSVTREVQRPQPLRNILRCGPLGCR